MYDINCLKINLINLRSIRFKNQINRSDTSFRNFKQELKERGCQISGTLFLTGTVNTPSYRSTLYVTASTTARCRRHSTAGHGTGRGLDADNECLRDITLYTDTNKTSTRREIIQYWLVA